MQTNDPISSDPQPAVRQPKRSRIRSRYHRPRLSTLLLLALFALAALAVLSLPLLVLLGGYSYYQILGRLAPGVRVGDTRLDWMTVEDAAIALHRDWNLGRELQVTDGLQSWNVPASEMGLSLDSIQTARRAFDVGRRQPMLAELRQVMNSWLRGWQVVPVGAFDPLKARQTLEALNLQATRPARNASLYWDGEQLSVIPGELGYTINIEASLSSIAGAPDLTLASGYLRLPLMPQIPQVNDVGDALAEAQHILDSTLTLNAYDPISNEQFQWEVPRQLIGSWLVIEPGAGGPVVSLDPDRMASYLADLSADLGEGRFLDGGKYAASLAEAVGLGQPFWMMVSHTATTYPVQAGDTLTSVGWKVGMPYWKILGANPGINPDALYAGQSLVIPSKDELLPLPVVINKRIVISISRQRLWIFQDGKELSVHVISTGIDRSPTQPGVFQVQTHEPEAFASVWDLYMPNFLGIYEAWPGFMNGIHGLPRLSNGRRLWAGILGKPASYGCIIMKLDAAEWLYSWAENGVVVEIQS